MIFPYFLSSPEVTCSYSSYADDGRVALCIHFLALVRAVCAAYADDRERPQGTRTDGRSEATGFPWRVALAWCSHSCCVVERTAWLRSTLIVAEKLRVCRNGSSWGAAATRGADEQEQIRLCLQWFDFYGGARKWLLTRDDAVKTEPWCGQGLCHLLKADVPTVGARVPARQRPVPLAVGISNLYLVGKSFGTQNTVHSA